MRLPSLRDRRVQIAGGFLAFAAAVMSATILYVRWERGRFLYYPPAWEYRSLLGRKEADADNQDSGSGGVGGTAVSVLPLEVFRYRVKEGDTLSGIAERFGMDLDTIASLNRQWGSGVHLIQVGEEIRIPNQDGIFLAVDRSFEKLCADKGVPPEAVLLANRLRREEVRAGMALFFPGVQHTGVERSVSTGTAFLRPVAGWTSSAFGYRRDPFTEAVQFHRGVDIAASPGAPVRASMDGKVAQVGWDPVLGSYIVIRHQIGYSTVYGHLQQVSVQPGAAVARGQRIGLVGSSGKSTGPHLHFEVRRNGRSVDTTGLLSTKR